MQTYKLTQKLNLTVTDYFKMAQPKWLKDVQGYIDSVVYGTAIIEPILIEREHKKTVSIQTTATETIRYPDNERALKDIMTFLLSLADAHFVGDEHLRLHYTSGDKSSKIELVGYTSVRLTDYSKQTKNKYGRPQNKS